MRGKLVLTPTVARLRRERARRQHEKFLPAAYQKDVIAVNRLHPHALIVWHEVRRMRAMGWSEPYTLSPDLRLTRWTANRALIALEKAGWVRVERKRGKLPRIWLLRTDEFLK
jgi:hypothetical protein